MTRGKVEQVEMVAGVEVGGVTLTTEGSVAGVLSSTAPPTTAAAPGLHGKLAAIMAEVGRVPKRGRNEFHKYDYATEADIVEAVRGALSARAVSLLPSVRQVIRDGTLTTVLMSFTFTDGDTGEQSSHDWAGTGDDKGDKGLYKAMTGALKYFLLKTFLLPTGDDPEADADTDQRASGAPRGKRGAAPASRPTCTKCGGTSETGQGLCATCARLLAARLADDKALLAAKVAGVPAPDRHDTPPGELRTERNRAFVLMNLHGYQAGDTGRGERLRLYAKALGRAAVSEAEAKTLTAAEWRTIGDRVASDNEPPIADAPPFGVGQ